MTEKDMHFLMLSALPAPPGDLAQIGIKKCLKETWI